MNGKYLGYLSPGDPLYWYFQEQITPQLGVVARETRYRVFQSSHCKNVYLYEIVGTPVKIVGKFRPPAFAYGGDYARLRGETEYRNLVFMRSLGFDWFPHFVVRPLGFNPGLDNLLVMEHAEGRSFSKIIYQAIFQGRRERLFHKLGYLAHFLAEFHNRTARDWRVNFHESCDYMGQLIRSLADRGVEARHIGELYHLREVWRHRGSMWEDCHVLVHGDATPSNFLFGHGRDVICFDLERMMWADRVFDLGRLCGELKHFYFRCTGLHLAAEPFIGHFLWEYSGHFPNREKTFEAVTRRLPFYMGITLLRIARNTWIDWEYRRRLIDEALNILRARV
jgi:hypothetical protein